LLSVCIVLSGLLYRQSNAILIKDTTYVSVETEFTQITGQTESVDKININTASKEELMTLSGIGETIAQRIIDYREEYGNFSSIEEIKNVTGIGEVRFSNIKDQITV
ncbi:MAG: helix-hairpin-helix domain-containing protein, partial [Ruminiclostridium sp.]|nr:helix-hairpin-helix domain-containing protein [Ruminiclostridium sp.]